MQSLADQLRDALRPHIGRDEGQISQSELARRTGITRTNITDWLAEDGRDLPMRHIDAIARACGVKIRVGIEGKPR